MFKTLRFTGVHGALAAALILASGNAAALEFQIGEDTLRIENLLTVGGSWRMQDRDHSLIGKSTLYKLQRPGSNDPDTGSGLCMVRVTQTARSGPESMGSGYAPYAENNNGTTFAGGELNRYEAGGEARDVQGVCSTSGDIDGPTSPTFVAGSANDYFLAAPGSLSPNGDNGNLNFDKHDLVHAIAKLTTDFNTTLYDFNLFARTIVHFDYNYSDFTQRHPDTTMQPATSDLSGGVEDLMGFDFGFLDYNIGRVFDVYDHSVSVKLGNQVLNWGESSLLALNSINTINPPDARRLNTPGLDLKEAFRPIGMLVVGTDLFENVSVETFYSYDWKPILIDPVGTYFSQSDTLGPGGQYAMLSFAKAPEDVGYAIDDERYAAGYRGYYRPIDTCDPDFGAPCADSLGLLGSTASRTIYRDRAEEVAREPDGGDYGFKVQTFLEAINNGTELSFYFANYDSRIPVVSGFAAEDSCLDTAPTLVTACGYAGPGQPTTLGEPIPVDTARLIVEYPKDIRMFGVSFNTTVGDYALSGEYAFRDNLPIQIDSVDLTYTLLQPAFPANDINLGAVTIPGRRSAFPAFLPGYRGFACTTDANCIQEGQYVPGFERFKVGQLNLTMLRLIGGDNPIGASQMTILLETGMQQVFNMPGLNELQLESGGSDTHISGGADGTPGIEPQGYPEITNDTLRQNPTAHKDFAGYGTDISYGYRLVNLNRWDSALFGINLETLAIVRHDVHGSSPGIGTNFTEGRKQFNFGLRGDYLSTWIGEVRYSWFTGGGKRDGQRDRDNIQVSLGYQF